MSDDEVRETCAGGVVVREEAGRHEVCLVLRDRHGPRTWCLPKGHPEPGEYLTETAQREVREETGLTGDIVGSLEAIRYRFRVKDDPRVRAKTVHFFLIRAREGDLTRHDAEVLEARWMPFEDAIARVTHENERQVLREAQRMIAGEATGNRQL